MSRSASGRPRVLRFAVPLVVLALAAGPAWGQAPLTDAYHPLLSTFSIVACDPVEGFLGVAIQSRVVGAGSIVPAAEAGVGAIATQAAANVAFKKRGLELLRQGRSAEEVRDAFVAEDPGIEDRQFAVVDSQCRVAAFTGDSTLAWAGHRTGEGYSVQGNILAGPGVVDSMAVAFERAEASGAPFGERLLAALQAAQAAGGDRRGQQGAGILIVKEGGGYGGRDDRYADLRVEDHVAPIAELARVYDVWMSAFHPDDHFVPKGSKPFSAPAGPYVCTLRVMLARAGYGEAPPEGRRYCAFDGDVLEALNAFQRAHGIRPGVTVDAETASKLADVAGEPG